MLFLLPIQLIFLLILFCIKKIIPIESPRPRNVATTREIVCIISVAFSVAKYAIAIKLMLRTKGAVKATANIFLEMTELSSFFLGFLSLLVIILITPLKELKF